jgi:tetratricopeptide (TPR) repeat protein
LGVVASRAGRTVDSLEALLKATELNPAYFRAWYNLGIARANAGELEGARVAYETSRKLHPAHFETAQNLALLLLDQGAPERALKILEEATKLAGGEQRARAWFALGVALGRLKRVDEALAAYDKAIEYRPAYLLPRYNQAVLHASLGSADSLQQAENIVKQLMALSIDFAPAWFLQGRIHSVRGNDDKALAAYDRAADLVPGFWKTRYNGALVAFRLKRMSDSERRFARLAVDFPNRPEPRFNIGRIAYAQDELDRATTEYAAALEIANGDYPEAEINQGLVLRAQGRNEEALTHFDSVLRKDAKSSSAMMNRALVLMALDRDSDARIALEEVILLSPDDGAAQYNLGRLESKLGKHEAAVKAYRLAIALRPDHLKAAVSLGSALTALERPVEAIAAYRQATKIDDGYSPAWYNLGLALRRNGQFQEAAEAYKRVVALDPEDVKSYKNLGVVYVKLGRRDVAMGYFQSALDLDPANTGVRYNLAVQYRKLGNIGQAELEFRRILQLSPKHKRAASSLSLILAKRKVWDEVLEVLLPLERAGSLTPILTRRLARARRHLGVDKEISTESVPGSAPSRGGH